ncbi:MAG: flagellar basal body P-ring protein FlgI [Candidatus Abyssobacteria bacterium SURF_5]|uniref:Flagellar P-ring protein n=1 Tax=Abyssobacteria bacterium (strain SURF_5) TaxID=2093360 RepID=A0A3A4P0A5_ABYX5|nr:MAG: flagellar basal body P-ring protein FlgI [Candidatus Abyssubacteria bacterium SURF_5]
MAILKKIMDKARFRTRANPVSRNLQKWSLSLFLALAVAAPALAQQIARVKDVAYVRGVRSNQLVGYGLVAGLNGTGDGRRVPFTRQMLANMVNQFGVTFDSVQLRAENVAAVMVTAELPPYAKEGAKLDATVSAIGDAESLQGGTLLLTALRAGNNEVYAVAQGPVSVGTPSTGRRMRGAHLTTGLAVQGAIVEKEVPSTIVGETDTLTICLRRADFTTAMRTADAINLHFHQKVAEAVDGGSIAVKIPQSYTGDTIGFISEMELAPVEPDTLAKVVINERTGTIVVGKDAVITPVAVSHGDIRIFVGGRDEAAALPDELHVLELYGAKVGEVASALNAIGVRPEDLVAIFEAIDRAGALQATLEFM